MIKCYLLNGSFQEKIFDDFDTIQKVVNENRIDLYHLKPKIIIEILNVLSKKIIRDTDINSIPGVMYIALWLKRENLERIYRINYYQTAYLDDFTSFENYFELFAQPRGIVCHWVAANISSLSFFSLLQAILSRNGSIVKVPEENLMLLMSLLKVLDEINVEIDGKKYFGKDIIRSIAVVSFPGKNHELSVKFSMIADVKMLWGGADAIKTINSLPQKEYCETIIFGPKYSFGVFDKDFIESKSFDESLINAVRDIVIFNQMACSSPHVFFFEKSKYSLKDISMKMKTSFEKIPEKYFNDPLQHTTALNIINNRGIYLLSKDKDVFKSDDLNWTILLNNDICLEEPIQGKCIFIKEINDINEVLPLITRKIQVLSVGIKDIIKKMEFAKIATYNGVDRIVVPGKMHDFDLPWDGVMTLNRLVRWVFVKN